MNTIVVISSGMFDDDTSVKVAFKAADILRHDYSTTVFVEVINYFNLLNTFNEMPKIRIGKNELVIDKSEDVDSIVNKVVSLVLANISNESINNMDEGLDYYGKKEPEAYAGVSIEY
ncbi:hypothetical protein [Caldisphaera sp.]|uniref:hypothetical protein n=1 Tax=Caldisphaera sp. TaxID=2060322 RepID=UPI003D0A932E